MNYKLFLMFFCLFTWLITIKEKQAFVIQSDIDLMNEIGSMIRETRSFGCNGSKDKNPLPCRSHCINRNFKGGKCSKSSSYTRCVCHKSPNSKSL